MWYSLSMNWLKKFWIVFVSFLPFSVGALIPFVIGAGAVSIVGFSIYRSVSPVNMADAFDFFSSCWTCQMFSDIMSTMSVLLPPVYKSLGHVMIPVMCAILGVWIAWNLLSKYIKSKIVSPWGIAGDFTNHFIKLGVVIALFTAPLPRLISSMVIDPLFNVGTSVNKSVDTNENYTECILATAITDNVSMDKHSMDHMAFSPHLIHSMACELSNVHQITGLGMTVGWTMMNMAFADDYQHKILWGIPIFPNVPIFFMGLLVTVLFFVSLLPIPFYFLEIFIKLSMDLIMLPFMFLGWVFSDWGVFKSSGKSIKGIIDDMISGVLGISMMCIFLSFAIMFLNAMFSRWETANILIEAIKSENGAKLLMDGLMFQNDSFITMLFMGIFMAMFMILMPTLIKTLFNVQISDKFYQTAKKDANIMWNGVKKIWNSTKK